MLLSWGFTNSTLGFVFGDDLFRSTDHPLHAWGVRSGGALYTELGGRDKAKVAGMSGGWKKTFDVEAEGDATLSFRYRVVMDGKHKKKDYADVLAEVDGKAVSPDGDPYVDRLYGSKSKKDTTTGWRTAEIDLGELDEGAHKLELGGYLSKKKGKKAETGVWIDSVKIDVEDAPAKPKPPKLGAFEADVIRFSNAYRAQNGRDPLEANAELSAAAEDWSATMASGDFFRHSDVAGQIARFGYDATGYGENIAAGQTTARAVVDGWIASPGHRANLLRADFEDVGVGHVYRANDGGAARYGHYWTQIFGTPDGDGLL
jgi:uncharacterized protein YkwD